MKTNYTGNIKKWVALALLLLAICLPFSCKKYLDAKTESREVIPATLTDCQYLLDNFAEVNWGYPTDGESSTDDLFVPDANLGSLEADWQEIYEWLPDAMHTNFTHIPSWQAPYAAILYVNLALDTYNKLGAADQQSAAGMNVKGEALFIRAGYFYELAQLYAKPYNVATAQQDMGVPLRLTSSLTETLSRGTLKQTYDQIIGDLTSSVSLLPDKPAFSFRGSKAGAYAELARVYLAMGDNANALANAKAALAINDDLVDYNALNRDNYYPFSTFPQTNSEVVFFSEQYNYQIPSYSYVAPDLYQLYDSNDLRRSLYFNDNGDGTFSFVGSYSGDGNFFSGLATDELYLVKAECEARAGSTTAALADLNALLVKRYVTGTFIPVTATSADDALAKILTERRKELVYRGTRWADLRRLNKDSRFAITLTRTVNGTEYTLAPNDPRYTLLLPADVIQYGGYQQNPR